MDNRHETQRSPLGSRAGPGRRPRSGRFRPTRLRRSPGHGLVTDWSRTGHGRRAPSAARMRPGRQRAAQPARSPGYRPGASRPGTDSGPAGPARVSVSRCRPGRAVGGACRAERRPWAGRSRGAQHTHTHPATSSFRRRPPASGPACANTPPGACKACTGARKACTKRRPCTRHAGHAHGMQGLACKAAFLPCSGRTRGAQQRAGLRKHARSPSRRLSRLARPGRHTRTPPPPPPSEGGPQLGRAGQCPSIVQ